jgi:hypothetical protein
MRFSILSIFSFLTATISALAQSDYNVDVPKDIVILQSTRDYAAALAGARQAAAKLGRPLKLAGYQPNKELGLSASKADCAGDGYDFPCYVPRRQGGAENSDYLSIEFSDGYTGFAKGYYIVVAALAPPNSAALRQTLARVQRAYPAAYAKRTSVWFGCMH